MLINIRRKKFLYLILGVVIISIFSLSIVYAALSSTLSILGNSEVVASNWDIHLDNIDVTDGSVSANSPSIDSNSSVGFDVELDKPGDFYEFTVDVVNGGTIDAMIDSVVKTPNLTEEQLKYIKYEVSYENGESISTKQTLKKGTSTPIKVRVEYRKDILASDLPSSVTELSLKLTLIYIQSDGSGSGIPNNGERYIKVKSGDINTIGSEVCIGDECFYVIDNDSKVVSMLAKYNLAVGRSCMAVNAVGCSTYKSDKQGLQDANALGYNVDSLGNAVFPMNGLVSFSNSYYWSSNLYPINVYDSNSYLHSYISSYVESIYDLYNINVTGRLIYYDELANLGCDLSMLTCSDKYDWIFNTSYWTGSAYNSSNVYVVNQYGEISWISHSFVVSYGVRPVIDIPVSEF